MGDGKTLYLNTKIFSPAKHTTQLPPHSLLGIHKVGLEGTCFTLWCCY